VETFSAWARSAVGTHVPQAAPRPKAFLAGFPALEAFPLPLWQRLTARCLRGEARGLLHYFPSMGYGPLRKATARYLALTRGVVCSPDQVMILNSSLQGLDLIGRVLLERGDEAWVEEAGYPNVRVSLSMSGVPLSLKRRLALLKWAEDADAWVVEDDYQGEFTHEGRPLETLYSLDRGARVLHLGSFTNALFPSLRLAYLVIPPAMCGVFEAVRSQLDDHTHGIAQAVLADFIDEGHLTAHLRRMKPIYKERRDVLLEALERYLPECKAGPAVSGMNVALHLPRGIGDRTLRKRGGDAGLALMPLSRYGARRR